LNVSFSLQNVLLQSEEELMSKRASELVSEGAASKPKKTIGKMKVQGTRHIHLFHLNTVSAAIFCLLLMKISRKLVHPIGCWIVACAQFGLIQKMPLGINLT
jgi:hypothetical protein